MRKLVCKGVEIQVYCIPLLVGLSFWVKLMVTYNSSILKKKKRETPINSPKNYNSHPLDSLFRLLISSRYFQMTVAHLTNEWSLSDMNLLLVNCSPYFFRCMLFVGKLIPTFLMFCQTGTNDLIYILHTRYHFT